MGNILYTFGCKGGEPPFSKEQRRYETIDNVWEWGYVDCDGAFNKLRRRQTPKSYLSLVDLIARVNKGEIKSYSVPGGEDYKTLQSEDGAYRNATNSIIGNEIKNKAHQLPKSKPCRCYYGPIAECAAGLKPIAPRWREGGWNALLMGVNGEVEDKQGNKTNMSVKGMEKLAENFLIMMKPHDNLYDTYDDGILLTFPIISLEDALIWKEGQPVNFLIAADPSGYSAPIETRNIPGLLTKATPEDIEKATEFVGQIIAALTDLIASDENDNFVDTMNEIIDVNPFRRGVFFGKESEYQTAKIHLQNLKTLRTSLRTPENKGKGFIPTKVISKKPLLKVNMEVWLQASNIDKSEDEAYYTVDPLLAGIKAGNGLYFAKTGTKLLPGCKRKDDGSEASDDSEESEGVPVHLLHQLLCNHKGEIQPFDPSFLTPKRPRPSEIKTPPTRTLDDDELSDISFVE